MHSDCLNRDQIKVLEKLGFLRDYGFYLAGGTALALQLGHRRSMDLDFYTPKKFDYKKLRNELEKKFEEAIFIQGSEGTLIMKLDKVAVSFFRYPYSLIFPTIKFNNFPPIASVKDTAAMKLIAIADRGIKRDFYDIYFLLQEFSLEEIFTWVRKKYPKFNIYSAVRGLTYFEDAEKTTTHPPHPPARFARGPLKYQRKVYLFQYVSWPKVKKILIEKTNEYRKKWLK